MDKNYTIYKTKQEVPAELKDKKIFFTVVNYSYMGTKSSERTCCSTLDKLLQGFSKDVEENGIWVDI